MRPAAALASLLALALALACAGCGSGGGGAARPPGPCPQPVAATVARVAGTPRASAKVLTRSYGLVTCRYTARRAGAPAVADVTTNTLPQPYTAFQTDVVHLEQFLTGIRGAQRRLPREIGGIGLDADWIPGQRRLLAADERAYVTVGVVSRSVGRTPPLAAAKEVARAVLRDIASRAHGRAS